MIKNSFVGLAWAFYTQISFATTFAPVPFPQSVQDAPLIVQGKVGMSYSDWGKNQAESKQLYTYTELDDIQALKGQASEHSIVIREMGGEKDGIGLHIPGTAAFKQGEDIVIFLKNRSLGAPGSAELPNRDDSYPVHGMMMGKYTLETNSEGEEILKGPGLLDEKTWTVRDLKKLITSQELLRKKETAQNGIPTPSPLAPPTFLTPRETSPSSAPRLQHFSQLEPSARFNLWIYLSIGLAGGLIVFFTLKYLRKNSRKASSGKK